MRASVSAAVRKGDEPFVELFGRVLPKEPLDHRGVPGWRSVAKLNRERTAVSRRLRVRALLCRACSRWLRKAVIRVGVEVAPPKREGALPVPSQANPLAVASRGGRDGPWTGLPLFGEAVGKERLQRRRDRAHRMPAFVWWLPGVSHKPSSSGAADRYQ